MDDTTKTTTPLPVEIEELFTDSALNDALSEILDKEGVPKPKQLSAILATEGVLRGVVDPKDFVKLLSEYLEIPREKAAQIAQAINRDVFNYVKDALKELHKVGQTPEEAVANTATVASTAPVAPVSTPGLEKKISSPYSPRPIAPLAIPPASPVAASVPTLKQNSPPASLPTVASAPSKPTPERTAAPATAPTITLPVTVPPVTIPTEKQTVAPLPVTPPPASSFSMEKLSVQPSTPATPTVLPMQSPPITNIFEQKLGNAFRVKPDTTAATQGSMAAAAPVATQPLSKPVMPTAPMSATAPVVPQPTPPPSASTDPYRETV